MARPQNVRLDYFPPDTGIGQDDKVAIIEAQYGMLGFAVIIKLLMNIYSEGYYYDWTEKEQTFFNKRVNVDINPKSKINKSSSNNTTAARIEKKNLVAPMDADSIQQDPEKRNNDLQRIENYYKQHIRRRNICSSRDLSDIVFVYETYKRDVDFSYL